MAFSLLTYSGSWNSWTRGHESRRAGAGLGPYWPPHLEDLDVFLALSSTDGLAMAARNRLGAQVSHPCLHEGRRVGPATCLV